MKKCITVMVIFILCFSLPGCGEMQNSGKTEIAAEVDFVQYNYNELKDNAKIIAEVKVLDDLSEENSVLLYAEDSPEELVGFYSLRTVQMLNVYKGTEFANAGETMQIIDNAAISKDCYYHVARYEELQKGNTYIVFLNNDTASGEMSIMSCENGVVDLSGIENSEYYDIAIKSVAEFKSDLSEAEIQEILSIREIKKENRNALIEKVRKEVAV